MDSNNERQEIITMLYDYCLDKGKLDSPEMDNQLKEIEQMLGDEIFKKLEAHLTTLLCAQSEIAFVAGFNAHKLISQL